MPPLVRSAAPSPGESHASSGRLTSCALLSPPRGARRSCDALRCQQSTVPGLPRGVSLTNPGRSTYHTLSRVTSGGGATSLLSVAECMASKDARLFQAVSYPWTPPSTHCETLSGRSWLRMPQTQEVHDSILVTEQGHERLGEELAGGWAQMQPVGH